MAAVGETLAALAAGDIATIGWAFAAAVTVLCGSVACLCCANYRRVQLRATAAEAKAAALEEAGALGTQLENARKEVGATLEKHQADYAKAEQRLAKARKAAEQR